MGQEQEHEHGDPFHSCGAPSHLHAQNILSHTLTLFLSLAFLCAYLGVGASAKGKESRGSDVLLYKILGRDYGPFCCLA